MPTLTTPSTVTFSLQVDQILTLTNNFGAGSVVLSAQRGGDVVFDYTNDQLRNTPIFSSGSQGIVTITHLSGSLTYDISTSSFGLTTTEVGATRALVSGAGVPWAGHASAVVAGNGTSQVFLLGGRKVLMYSDGTYWRPANGNIVLASIAGSITAPIASGTRVAGAAFLMGLPGGGVLIPAGLLIPRQSQLVVSAYWSKTGAAAGMNCVTLIGSTNSLSDSQTTNAFIGGVATAIWNMENTYAIDTTTRIQGSDTSGVNLSAGATANREFTTNINTAADMWVNFGSTSGTDGDGLLLTRILVQVFQ